MAIDHSFIIKQLQTAEEMFAAFSPTTRHPFVTCDEESYNDQVHIFLDESQACCFAESYDERKIPITVGKIPQAQFLNFYARLYNLGINAVVLHDKNTATELALESIVKREPDISKIPPEKRPIVNPELQLTALYLLQELRRQIPQEEKQGLAALDEELVAHLMKARFLSAAVPAPDGVDTDEKKQIQFPLIKSKNGDMYQTLFTDMYELKTFDPEQKLRPLALSFADLDKLLIKESKGYILNPGSYAITLRREQLDKFNGKTN